MIIFSVNSYFSKIGNINSNNSDSRIRKCNSISGRSDDSSIIIVVEVPSLVVFMIYIKHLRTDAFLCRDRENTTSATQYWTKTTTTSPLQYHNIYSQYSTSPQQPQYHETRRHENHNPTDTASHFYSLFSGMATIPHKTTILPRYHAVMQALP